MTDLRVKRYNTATDIMCDPEGVMEYLKELRTHLYYQGKKLHRVNNKVKRISQKARAWDDLINEELA